jgi:hypothetical protein
MANNKTGSSISKSKLEELRKRAENKRAGSSATYKSSDTGSSVSATKLAELRKKAEANSKKPTKQSVPSMIAEMRSKANQKTSKSKSTGSSVSAAKLAELKVKAKKDTPKKQSVPSMIAEMRSKRKSVAPKSTKTTATASSSTTAKTKPSVTKTSSAINYNVGESKGGVSFKKAFAHFRKKGAKTFTWNGKKYTTELAKKGKK